MKHQSSTYFIQVRLPAALQRSLRDVSDGQGGADGVCRDRSAPDVGPSRACPSVRLPLFSDEELQTTSFSTVYRGVVTVTIPSAATCFDAIGYILAAAGSTDRSPRDYQLVQCFADFSPDHTRQRLTGDSSSMAIKTVMQFPFHLALVLSPYVVLRERLMEDEEPLQRSSIIESYRKQFLQFCVGYQTLLFRLIEQANFLRGRQEEARRGKKLEERQQFFELSRFRTLREEKDSRNSIEKYVEVLERDLIRTEERALIEKMMMCDSSSSPWLREHALFTERLSTQLAVRIAQDLLLRTLISRLGQLDEYYTAASLSLIHAKQRLYNISRSVLSIDESVSVGDVTAITPHVVEEHRRRCAPMFAPQLYCGIPMLANSLAILNDVHSSTRSQVL